jgi:dienelactone hydrolase
VVAAVSDKATWFAYFPEDYRWSFNMLIAFDMVRTGGADVGEIDQVGRRLADHGGDDDHWFREWVTMADRVRLLAEDAEARGRRHSAASHYRRASGYYLLGERFRFPKDDDALDAYRRCVHCFRRATELGDGPAVEYVDIPYEGATLPAFLVQAENATSATPPVVVFFTGFDGNKELNWFLGIEELVKRGVSCLSVDSPGVGEAIRFQNIPLRYDYEAAGSAAIEFLEQRDDVDPGRIGVMGMSLGGYYAPRCAAMDQRFKACIAWGAQWDYYDVWERRISASRELQLPVPGDHLPWNTGTSSPGEALAALERFRLDGVAQQITCPVLVCHGEDDQQIGLADAQQLFEAVGSEDKTLRIFTGEEGGAQHCNLDNLSVATPVIFDWIADRLGA